ncbi:hypothetical protein THAOC_30031 [Thalassiosira oceanica]|uniref:Uncharacterized protein n=1 Tax=Thalassiosira oceanica TaxID=159749 RepID=K0RPN5_THAOC|nr:hypothetical protein THAOC_30031 [Thalassiosira oceanica]|eukprot:EJK50861.1 hypothetical protein THAOC_30031 [Thalassiosira oceanica]
MAKSIRSKAKRKNRTEFRNTIGTKGVKVCRGVLAGRDTFEFERRPLVSGLCPPPANSFYATVNHLPGDREAEPGGDTREAEGDNLHGSDELVRQAVEPAVGEAGGPGRRRRGRRRHGHGERLVGQGRGEGPGEEAEAREGWHVRRQEGEEDRREDAPSGEDGGRQGEQERGWAEAAEQQQEARGEEDITWIGWTLRMHTSIQNRENKAYRIQYRQTRTCCFLCVRSFPRQIRTKKPRRRGANCCLIAVCQLSDQTNPWISKRPVISAMRLRAESGLLYASPHSPFSIRSQPLTL